MRRRGSAAVEFALVLPALALLLAGALEWGWYLRHEVVVIHLARDAAAAGALTKRTDGPADVAEVRAWDALTELHLDPQGAQVNGTLTDTALGPLITLEVNVPYQPLLSLVPSPATLRAEHSTLLVNR